MKACHFALDTGALRTCTAKRCYEERVHYAPGQYARSKRPIVQGGRRVAVIELDAVGKIVVLHESITAAARAAGITVPAMMDRIRNRSAIKGHRWRKAVSK